MTDQPATSRPRRRGRPPKYGEPTKRVHIHIPVSLHEQLTDLADTQGLSLGELLINAAAPLLNRPQAGEER